MRTFIIEKNSQVTKNPSQPGGFKNLDFTKLLDAITSILIEEYVEIAKNNRNIFEAEKTVVTIIDVKPVLINY